MKGDFAGLSGLGRLSALKDSIEGGRCMCLKRGVVMVAVVAEAATVEHARVFAVGFVVVGEEEAVKVGLEGGGMRRGFGGG